MIDNLKQAGFDIALYTGYSINEVPNNIIEKINYIKTGEYCYDLQTSVTAYIGSTNQTFYTLSDS